MDNLLLCEDCNWTGKQEDCVRKGRGVQGIEDITVYLMCPKCGSENLIELMGRRAVLEPVPA